jgi:cupin 2 domain-containing protein
MTANIFTDIPMDSAAKSGAEIFQNLAAGRHVRIERIISRGHSSAPDYWYEQTESEWVMVVEGAAILSFEGGEQISLAAGDYIDIAAGRKHRVAWTDPDAVTIWLAVYYT